MNNSYSSQRSLSKSFTNSSPSRLNSLNQRLKNIVKKTRGVGNSNKASSFQADSSCEMILIESQRNLAENPLKVVNCYQDEVFNQSSVEASTSHPAMNYDDYKMTGNMLA